MGSNPKDHDNYTESFLFIYLFFGIFNGQYEFF